MFHQLSVSTDKHINQSILTGRHEDSAPWSDHQSFFSSWLKKSIPTYWSLTINYLCWFRIVSYSAVMLIIYFITQNSLWSNWDIIAKLQLISLKGCRKLTRSYSEAPSNTYVLPHELFLCQFTSSQSVVRSGHVRPFGLSGCRSTTLSSDTTWWLIKYF